MDSQSVKNSSPDLSLKRNRERKAAGLRPTADPRALFPICDTTRVAVALGNRDPRLLSENILKLHLDFAERTTFDLFGEEIGEGTYWAFPKSRTTVFTYTTDTFFFYLRRRRVHESQGRRERGATRRASRARHRVFNGTTRAVGAVLGGDRCSGRVE
jgi:hypothetical protein